MLAVAELLVSVVQKKAKKTADTEDGEQRDSEGNTEVKHDKTTAAKETKKVH